MSRKMPFDEARRALGVSEEELQRMVSEGEIRAFRDGNRMAFRASDIKAILEERDPDRDTEIDPARPLAHAPDPEYRSFEDVMTDLGIDEEELKRMVSEGEIAAMRHDNRMCFLASDVQARRREVGLPSHDGKEGDPTIEWVDAGGKAEPTPKPADRVEDIEILPDVTGLVESDASTPEDTEDAEPKAPPPRHAAPSPTSAEREAIPVARVDPNPPSDTGVSPRDLLFVLIVASLVAILLALLT